MRISIAIQHHPARAHLIGPLLAGLPGAELATDPEPGNTPSPWRTYRHALKTTPPGVTHRLIVQDDVILCRDFAEVAPRAVAARPDRLLAFFVGGQPVEHARAIYHACDADLSWAELDNLRWCPVLALCWPVAMIEPFLHFVDAQNWPAAFRSDDEIVGRWLRASNQLPLATVPSLVEHPDVEPSLIGRRAWAGADQGRIAACFIHPQCDPRTIDWTLGPS